MVGGRGEERFQFQFWPQGEGGAVELELRHARPGFFGGGAAEPKDAKQFVNFGVAVEERGEFHHFRQDRAHRPSEEREKEMLNSEVREEALERAILRYRKIRIFVTHALEVARNLQTPPESSSFPLATISQKNKTPYGRALTKRPPAWSSLSRRARFRGPGTTASPLRGCRRALAR